MAHPWLLRIRLTTDIETEPGIVAGTGFAVTEYEALTCAHVVEPSTECWVEVPGREQEPQRCSVKSLKVGDASASDVAVLALHQRVPPAQLGPWNPPVPGTELELIGFPERYSRRPGVVGADDREERTHVRITGLLSNGLLQVDRLHGYASLEGGYSGSPAVDLLSGRVVGMAVEDRPGSKVAWVIPLATIARFWQPLGALLPETMAADPEFRWAVEDLSRGAYGDALNRLNKIFKIYPDEADIYYYRVLAALGGKRPGGCMPATIEAMVKLLERALRVNPAAAHVQALLTLINEDYYVTRGLWPHVYVPKEPGQIPPEHIHEIVLHVPAVECPTWKSLHRRSL